jgi:hypothetical protein
VGLLKIEVSMVDSGVEKALAESGFCSIGLLFWVRACWQSVLCGFWLWNGCFVWYLRGYLALTLAMRRCFMLFILFNDVLMWVVLGF